MPPFSDPEAQKKYQREWIAKRRNQYLEGKQCEWEDCDSTEDLEVDHIDPAQKITHRIWSWSEKRRNAELAKTQILCHPHHRQKTYGWATTEPEHGRYKYEIEGCRCEVCKASQRDHWIARKSYAGKNTAQRS